MIDEELPGGFQDADLEMTALTAAANRETALRKRGLCTHGWTGRAEGQPGLRVCYQCGKVAREETLEAERADLLS